MKYQNGFLIVLCLCGANVAIPYYLGMAIYSLIKNPKLKRKQ